jgi:hypothetical protein
MEWYNKLPMGQSKQLVLQNPDENDNVLIAPGGIFLPDIASGSNATISKLNIDKNAVLSIQNSATLSSKINIQLKGKIEAKDGSKIIVRP